MVDLLFYPSYSRRLNFSLLQYSFISIFELRIKSSIFSLIHVESRLYPFIIWAIVFHSQCRDGKEEVRVDGFVHTCLPYCFNQQYCVGCVHSNLFIAKEILTSTLCFLLSSIMRNCTFGRGHLIPKMKFGWALLFTMKVVACSAYICLWTYMVYKWLLPNPNLYQGKRLAGAEREIEWHPVI